MDEIITAGLQNVPVVSNFEISSQIAQSADRCQCTTPIMEGKVMYHRAYMMLRNEGAFQTVSNICEI
jgi:hypothetical protein